MSVNDDKDPKWTKCYLLSTHSQKRGGLMKMRQTSLMELEEKSEYAEDMVKTNIVMPPQKRARDITINEGGSHPPKKGRQESPPGNKGKGKRPILPDSQSTDLGEAGTVVPLEVTSGTNSEAQGKASGTDAQTYGATV
uniref:Integrase core domain containing protein n=1 Tax=Solanum tuberosum TaxID=4113 RepID=M1DFU6_SOLTU